MKKERPLRRKYIINKPFQFGYVAIIIVLLLLVAGAVGLLTSYLYLFVFNDGRTIFHHNSVLFTEWTILAGFAIIILTIWGVFYTHRIVGPIHRTRLLLQEAASGNIPDGKILFRKKDMFKELEKDLQDCFETMKKYQDEYLKNCQKRD